MKKAKIVIEVDVSNIHNDTTKYHLALHVAGALGLNGLPTTTQKGEVIHFGQVKVTQMEKLTE